MASIMGKITDGVHGVFENINPVTAFLDIF